MEKLKITKTGKSKFGWYVMNEASAFTGCTEEVSNFLEKQVPCDIEIEKSEGEGKYMKILRAKVTSAAQPTQNEMDQPIETIKPGEIQPADEYVDARQNSIESQMCIYAGLRMIEINNALEGDKIKPTQDNVRTNALLAKNILREVKKG